MKLPEFTHHVICEWPDGDILSCETHLDRETAFDWACDFIAKHGCNVLVERIERNEYGAALTVSDITEELYAERGPVANEWSF